MTEQQALQLAYPFKADEIEWRLLLTTQDNKKGLATAFVDSRAIQNRLDRVLGNENWQNRFTVVPGNAKDDAAYICEIGIWFPERKEWIFKSDGAGCTDIEPVKGGLSGALKRAASMWNLGRYLYEMQSVWVDIEVKSRSKIIKPEEMKRLAGIYNQMVKVYLSAKQNTPAAKNKPAAQTASAPVPAPPKEAYRVVDLKVTHGRNGAQALVSLKKNDGEAFSGYIRGETDLQRGQVITKLDFTPRTDPVVGKYNIINSFELAA